MSEQMQENESQRGSRALPTLRLIRENDHVLFVPGVAPAVSGTDVEPARLPVLPKMLTDHLALLCELVWQRHRRCFAVVLLLNPNTQDWCYAVPRQRCGRTASCWSTLRRDVPEAPEDTLLAGSFQTRVLAPGEDPADAVPPLPGVHMVHTVQPEHEIRCFLRVDDQTHPVAARVVIVDDMEVAMQGWLPRLTFSP
jgi:hypothetical protein